MSMSGLLFIVRLSSSSDELLSRFSKCLTQSSVYILFLIGLFLFVKFRNFVQNDFESPMLFVRSSKLFLAISSALVLHVFLNKFFAER